MALSPPTIRLPLRCNIKPTAQIASKRTQYNYARSAFGDQPRMTLSAPRIIIIAATYMFNTIIIGCAVYITAS